jgi:putative methyltransferase (TIGR04325 family)
MKYYLIQKIPSTLFVCLRGSGWSGSYKTWSYAANLTTGYDKENILEKVKNIHRKMKVADLPESRGIIFSPKQYAWEVCTALLWIAVRNKGLVRVLDFGGSLGTLYYQHKLFFDALNVQWNVVETAALRKNR